MISNHSDNGPGEIVVMKKFNLKKREERQAIQQKNAMRKLTISSLDTSSNSNTFDLGIARRPSDNLLLKFNQVSSTRSNSNNNGRNNNNNNNNVESTHPIYEDRSLNPVDVSDVL